ncbi:hypothetical protein JMJ58_18555 [Haloterrigena salifodinae]|uniref:Uncharacterized protein n=1 Tax=Haloterrigena salifodinae TaxID=2675099 RepID=A0A8T8DZX8_9EURY|nr:hypothetical protein [Haloterrigena salifodinae]QRV14892.1 hypothetical protein JMJ58_18555 [Haloterrigena salifodinae]
MDEKEPSELERPEPRQDLADRYQQMLDRQLTAISNFDTKAWRVARMVGILLGIFFTGASIFSSNLKIKVSVELVPIIGSVAVGLIALILSLIFAALCILSTTAGFGIRVELADALNEGSLDKEDYPGIVAKGYAKNVDNNIKVMQAKGRRLRYALSSLIFGIVELSTGAFLLFTTPSLLAQSLTVLLMTLLTSGIVVYILQMRYSVLKSEENEE